MAACINSSVLARGLNLLSYSTSFAAPSLSLNFIEHKLFQLSIPEGDNVHFSSSTKTSASSCETGNDLSGLSREPAGRRCEVDLVPPGFFTRRYVIMDIRIVRDR